MKTIAVDFDGVLHAYSKGWNGGSIYDSPVPGSQEAIRSLQHVGFEVIIFTTRENLSEVSAWLVRNEFPSVAVTNRKPLAFAYIDDRAIRFTNWGDMLRYFI